MDLRQVANWIGKNPYIIESKSVPVKRLILGIISEDLPSRYIENLENSIFEFTQNTSEPLTDFYEVADFFSNHGVDLIKLFSEFMFNSHSDGMEKELKIDVLADATGHYSLKFLCAYQSFQQGNFKKTIEICNSTDKTTLDFIILKSDSHARQGSLEEAKEELENALINYSTNTELLLKLSRLELIDKNIDHSFQLLKKVFEYSENSLQAIWILLELALTNAEKKEILNYSLSLVEKKSKLITKNQDLVNQTLKFLISFGTEQQFTNFIKQIDWMVQVNDPIFRSGMGSILRQLQAKKWTTATIKLADYLIPATKKS